jgi:hypothetical protein
MGGGGAVAASTALDLGVEVGLGHDSNPAQRQRGAAALWYQVVAPSLVARREDEGSRIQGTLRAEVLRHAGRPELDRANVELSTGGVHGIGTHAAAAWQVTLQDWRDPVGSNSLVRVDDEPYHFVAGAAGLVLRQDALDGVARLEAELTLSRKQYQNHRAVTVVGDLATRGAELRAQTLAPAGQFQGLLEWRGVVADYPFLPAGLSHEDHRLLVGVRVDAVPDSPGPWSLQAKLGWQRLGFPGLRPTARAPIWDLQWQWQPDAATRIEASTQRQQMVSPGDLADALQSVGWRLGWAQAWAPGLTGTLSWTGTRLHYRYGGFADGENRRERLHALELSLRRELGAGWALVASAMQAQRRADVDGFAYRRRVVRLALDWTG